MSGKRKLLFLCTGNACRSQMAEGWARKLLGDIFDVRSAGIDPQGVDPRAVAAMAEAGVDIAGHTSKHVDALGDWRPDIVVAVCDNAWRHCPVFPGEARLVHHGFPDPPALAAADIRARAAADADCECAVATEEEALWHYRRVRDRIHEFVQTLPDSLDDWGRSD